MNKVLCLDSSPGAGYSVSLALAKECAETLKLREQFQIKHRDLTVQPVPHVSGPQVTASFTPLAQRTNEQKELLKLSDQLCAELQEATVVVISTPMWNFGIPSVLKAWIDHVVRAGVTFQYSEAGPKGLLQNISEVLIIEACGGMYDQPPMVSMNHCGPYLKDIFNFLGVQNVSIVSAYGTMFDREAALGAGRAQLRTWLNGAQLDF